MSFYKGRINYGEEYFAEDSIPIIASERNAIYKEYINNAYDGPGKHILKTRINANVDKNFIELTAKVWAKNPTISNPSGVWKAGLPGWLMGPWFIEWTSKMSVMLPYYLIYRRSVEDIAAKTGFNSGITTKHDKYKLMVNLVANWFEVYTEEWLEKTWNQPYYANMNEGDKAYDIIFCVIPVLVENQRPDLMRHTTGDHDELLRCMRVLYCLLHMTGSAELWFENKLMKPLRRHYGEFIGIEKGENFKLWEHPMLDDLYSGVDLLSLENYAMGQPDRDPSTDERYHKDTKRFTMNIILDWYHMIRYININSGSYYVLDMLVGKESDTPLVRSPRPKRRIGQVREWDYFYRVNKVWIDPDADLFYPYERLRREEQREITPFTPAMFRAIAQTNNFDFIKDPDLREFMEEFDENHVMDIIYEAVSSVDPIYKEILTNKSEKEKDVLVAEILDGTVSKNMIFTARVDPEFMDEYKFFTVHIYNHMITTHLPKMSDWQKITEGVFSSKVVPKVKPVLTKFIKEEVGLTFLTQESKTVGDFFTPTMIALYNRINLTKFRTVDSKIDFFTLYSVYGRNKDEFIDIMKSVLTVLTGSPRISKYVIGKFHTKSSPQYTGRQKMFDEITNNDVGTKQYWNGEEILREILRTSGYNVFISDSILLKELLEIKL
uniref:ORF21 n=1 Tax=Malaco herpesvirus 1 TaxID=3031797 RepID=A0AA48SFG9_9VIRU|nr:TPA_asm: ORF21 [Malaco herpesvirus 1]